MSKKSKSSGMMWGIILIAMGALFLFQNFNFLDIGDILSTFWPLILVALGLKIIYDRKSANEDEADFEVVNETDKKKGTSQLSSDKISNTNVFGDVNINITSQQFSGGSVSNVFGDVRIDLSQARVIDKNCKLFVNGIFGSIHIKLPKSVSAKIKANSIAGEINLKEESHDGLFVNEKLEDPNFKESAERIYINSSIVFGSVTVN